MKVGHAYDTSIVKGVHDELTSKATHLLLEKKQVYEKSAENKDMHGLTVLTQTASREEMCRCWLTSLGKDFSFVTTFSSLALWVVYSYVSSFAFWFLVNHK